MSDSWLLTHDVLMFNLGVISFLLSTVLAGVCNAIRFNPNIWHIPRNIIRLFIQIICGHRYIAKIDGVWRVVKGSKSKSGFLHTDKLFPDNKSYCLSSDEYNKIDITMDDEELYNEVTHRNLTDLKCIHPNEHFRPRGRPQNPFAEPEQQCFQYINNPHESGFLEAEVRMFMSALPSSISNEMDLDDE